MALMSFRERRTREDSANYERQIPERDIHYRQAGNSQDYMQGMYDGGYQQGYAQSQPYSAQQGYQQSYQQPQYTGFFQQQASQFVNNGFNAPQYSAEPRYYTPQEQYQQDMQFNQDFDRAAHAKRITQQRTGKKKSINKDMIKIIVTIMVIAVTICALLIANQFISVNQAQAEDDIQSIDSKVLSSVKTADGTYTQTSVTVIPEYEYEESSNWFDKLCDSLGLKLK